MTNDILFLLSAALILPADPLINVFNWEDPLSWRRLPRRYAPIAATNMDFTIPTILRPIFGGAAVIATHAKLRLLRLGDDSRLRTWEIITSNSGFILIRRVHATDDLPSYAPDGEGSKSGAILELAPGTLLKTRQFMGAFLGYLVFGIVPLAEYERMVVETAKTDIGEQQKGGKWLSYRTQAPGAITRVIISIRNEREASVMLYSSLVMQVWRRRW
ncbi:hypothetical protein DL93DRAFT_2096713 [Clavulina sp. PMI_390]|nr:hypothetical protein DL93DRAFT_2096713 [Clavulina sp. PMI_390]